MVNRIAGSGFCAGYCVHHTVVFTRNLILAGILGLMIPLLLVISPFAQAHNVIGGVYAIGNTIEGEVGFSNGDMAAEGTEVLVTDAAGNELGRVLIDAEGLFKFEAKQRIDHKFMANLSSGHVLELTLPAADLPESLSASKAVKPAEQQPAPAPASARFDADQAELQLMIEKAVAKQVKPLRQELTAYKEKAGLQDIIGGIGYIFGLCGLGIWWRQRQKDKQQEKDNAAAS